MFNNKIDVEKLSESWLKSDKNDYLQVYKMFCKYCLDAYGHTNLLTKRNQVRNIED